MPYTPQLVVSGSSTTTSIGVLGTGLRGMPDPSRYLLFSWVTCMPASGGAGIGLGISSLLFAANILNGNRVQITIAPAAFSPNLVNATFNAPFIDVRSHLLVSVDTVGQILQVYLNDAPLALTSGGWAGSGMMTYGAYGSQWELSANYGNPGVADFWMASPASFFDLSVTANRRKFINADLSLVDLGVNGSEPLGTPPPIFLTVRPGDTNANDFALNNGSDGSVGGSGHGPWTIQSSPLIFQPGGLCSVPYVPPPPPTGSLAMDNVLALDLTPANVADTQIFLMWSDDRGHSYGSPVGQPIGAPGAYLTSPQWQRLGYSRDRVWLVEWSVPVATALLGAYIDVDAQAKS